MTLRPTDRPRAFQKMTNICWTNLADMIVESLSRSVYFRRPPLESSVVLTGTWLDRGKPVPGLFFLLLLLLFVPPPPLMVLPPDILRFRRLLGACLDGSANREHREGKVTQAARRVVRGVFCVLCAFAYLAAPPSSAISGRGRSWGSLWGWGCRSCVWTSAPAWAPKSHTAGGQSRAEKRRGRSNKPETALMATDLQCMLYWSVFEPLKLLSACDTTSWVHH